MGLEQERDRVGEGAGLATTTPGPRVLCTWGLSLGPLSGGLTCRAWGDRKYSGAP